MKTKCLELRVVILSLIASLLRTAERCNAKKVEICVALLHVPRYPTDYISAIYKNSQAAVVLGYPLVVQEGPSTFVGHWQEDS